MSVSVIKPAAGSVEFQCHIQFKYEQLGYDLSNAGITKSETASEITNRSWLVRFPPLHSGAAFSSPAFCSARARCLRMRRCEPVTEARATMTMNDLVLSAFASSSHHYTQSLHGQSTAATGTINLHRWCCDIHHCLQAIREFLLTKQRSGIHACKCIQFVPPPSLYPFYIQKLSRTQKWKRYCQR